MKLPWGVALGVLAMASVATAGGQGCQGEGNQPLNRIGLGSTPTSFYYNASGTFLQADGLEGFVVLDLGSEGPVRFPLDAGFRMSADKRTRLHGIKDLELADFQRGDRVQLKFSSFDGRAVRLKLKPPQ